MRYLALLPVFLSLQLKIMLQYRADFLMGLLSQLIYTALSVVFIDSVMAPDETLKGWSFWQVVFLFGFGDVAFGLNAIFLFRLFLSFEAAYVIHGKLDQLLVQPVPALYGLVLSNIDLNHLAVVAKGVVLIVVAASMLGLTWTPGSLAMLALLAASAAAVYGGVYVGFLSLGFWFRRRASLSQPVLSLSYLTQYPLPIYPGPLQVALTFVLPLGLATFYPAQAFLGLATPSATAIIAWWMLPPVALAIAGLGTLVFLLGLRSYASSGT
jgi:ABC-2 type transport system permease protein